MSLLDLFKKNSNLLKYAICFILCCSLFFTFKQYRKTNLSSSVTVRASSIIKSFNDQEMHSAFKALKAGRINKIMINYLSFCLYRINVKTEVKLVVAFEYSNPRLAYCIQSLFPGTPSEIVFNAAKCNQLKDPTFFKYTVMHEAIHVAQLITPKYKRELQATFDAYRHVYNEDKRITDFAQRSIDGCFVKCMNAISNINELTEALKVENDRNEHAKAYILGAVAFLMSMDVHSVKHKFLTPIGDINRIINSSISRDKSALKRYFKNFSD